MSRIRPSGEPRRPVPSGWHAHCGRAGGRQPGPRDPSAPVRRCHCDPGLSRTHLSHPRGDEVVGRCGPDCGERSVVVAERGAQSDDLFGGSRDFQGCGCVIVPTHSTECFSCLLRPEEGGSLSFRSGRNIVYEDLSGTAVCRQQALRAPRPQWELLLERLCRK